MPVISQIDKNSEHPIRRFIATAGSYRLQLAAVPDVKDPQTGKINKGAHQVAQFRHGIFETNIPEVIKRVEESYAYGTEVKDYEELIKEAKDKRYDDLLAMAKDDPDMLSRLRKDLDKKATKEQKERAKVLDAEVKAEATNKE